MRDLTRAREDMKAAETRSRQRLGAYLLRHGRVYSGKSRWTQAHFRWLEEQRFELPLQQLVFQEYVDAAIAAGKRTDALVAQMHEMLTTWSQRPTAEALMSLRGVSTITAMTVLAELGDLTRFDSPRELVGFLGLAPGEYSSGSRRRQGAITKTGNGHVRRLLVESAWAYRFPARKTAHLRRKAAKGPRIGCRRSPGRRRNASAAGMRSSTCAGSRRNKVVTAVARELVGFIWAIACEVGGKPHGTRAVA